MRDSGEQTSHRATVAGHRVNYHWSVPIWVVWKLAALNALGWGYDVTALRLNSKSAFIAAGGFLLFTISEYVIFFVRFVHPPSFESGVALLLNGFVPVIIGNIAISLFFAISGIIQRRRAEAGEHQAPVTLDGYCFDTVLVRSLPLFALIGMTREQARWFSLPIEWDMVVVPYEDRFELTYTPATGFVERLWRIGVEPRELSQGVDVAPSEGKAAVADATDGEATTAQRRELKRDFRRAGPAWGVKASSLLTIGLAFLLGGVASIAMIIFIVVLLSVYPQPHAQASNTLAAAAVYCALFGSLGIGLLIWGARVLRIWAQRRHAEAEPLLVSEGEQVCWTPYRDLYGGANESLALVRLDNGEQRIFRIPGRWAHRLWSENARVRVTYNERTGLVLDYRMVTSPGVRTLA